MQRAQVWIVLLSMVFLLGGCRAAYYSAWEKAGKEKRHLLQDQVKAAKEDQAGASEGFKTVITRVKELYGFEGGDLEAYYNDLVKDYNMCHKRAEKVEDRIESVEQIASDLFAEWGAEIKDLNNPQFQENSRQQLAATRVRYDKMHASMRASADKMWPVLNSLNDYVIYLKHNLNARVMGSLKKEMTDIEGDVTILIEDISASIDAADVFLKDFE